MLRSESGSNPIPLCIGIVVALLASLDAQKILAGDERPPHNKAVVCYIASWAVYRPGRGAFDIDNIDPSLCTHLVYAFAGLNVTSSSIRSLNPYHDLEEERGKGTYKKMTSLRKRYPHLKVTLAIGGWNEGSTNYSIMASSPNRRQTFITSVVKLLRTHNFDGLDLDWEFPAKRDGVPEDKENFVSLVRELREEFDKHGWLLTAALGAGPDTIDAAYDVPALSRYLDLLHIMCYDYHGTWDKQSGPNAPLRPFDDRDMLNVEYSIKYLMKLGAPASKLVLGLPMYGRTFFLSYPMATTTRLRDPVEEKGFQGPYTREDGYMGYNEICDEFAKNESLWELHWDDKTSTPFAIQENRVIAYDDERSLTEKVKFAMDLDLAGLMIWSIDTDDFHGDCKLNSNAATSSFPLMNLIEKVVVQAIQDKSNEISQHDKHDSHHHGGAAVSTASLFVPFLALLAVKF